MAARGRSVVPTPCDRRGATAWTRRACLAAGASCSLALLALPLLPLGCARDDSDAALVRALRTHYGDPADAAPIAHASGWDLDRALRVLRRDPGITPADENLRAALGARIRLDFVDDRLQLLDRRWLSETEIAIAVAVAGASG